MRIDAEIIGAMAVGLGATAEVALTAGWDEATFVKMARLAFRKERDGRWPASLADGEGEERSL